MNLTNFEKNIDPTILLRGQDIFNSKNLIQEPKKIEDNIYYTIVSGTDDYNVRVVLDNEFNIKNTGCDCPFDKGPICKHQVAVFYALRKLINIEIKTKNNSNNKKEKSIDKITNNKEYFKGIITESIKYASGRNGYVPWDRTYESLEGAEEVVSMIDGFIAEKNYTLAAIALGTLIQTLIIAVQDVDDSDGSYGDIISGTCIGEYLPNIIDEINKNGTKKDKDFFFDEFLGLVLNKDIYGFDFEKEILENMFGIIDNELDATKIYDIIEKLDSDNELFNYKLQKYKIISKFSPEKLDDFLSANKYDFSLQSFRIDEFIECKKYLEAQDILTEFYENDKKNQRFHISILERLLVVSQKINDKELIKKYSFEIFSHSPTKANYLSYKNSFDLLEFNKNIENIFAEFDKYTKIINYHEHPDICLEENFEKRFIDYFFRNPYVSNIDKYFTKLLKLIPDDLYSIYKKDVLDNLKVTKDRKFYKEQCRKIRKMFKIKDEETKIFIQELISKYKQRRALIEELNSLVIN